MGLVESWETGVRRIMEAATEYELPIPEFQTFDDMFRVNLYRKSVKKSENIGKGLEKHRRNIGETSEEYSKLNETQKKILELLSQNSQLSALKMSQEIGISSGNVESNIQILKKEGFLIRHGTPKMDTGKL